MTMRNFHLPLPSEVYQSLQTTAKRLRKPATQVARQAVEAWLKERHAGVIDEEISAYANKCAGTAHDLDGDLEDAAVAHLLAEDS